MIAPAFPSGAPPVRARAVVAAALVLGITPSALGAPLAQADTSGAPTTTPVPSPPIEPLAPPPPETTAIGAPPAPSEMPAPGTAPAPVPAPAPAPMVLNAAPPPHAPPEPDRPIFERWWFWTAIAAFAVTAVVIVATSSGPNTPKTDLGNMSAF